MYPKAPFSCNSAMFVMFLGNGGVVRRRWGGTVTLNQMGNTSCLNGMLSLQKVAIVLAFTFELVAVTYSSCTLSSGSEHVSINVRLKVPQESSS
eukprot:2655607-Amphidinium_carterae.1